MPLLTLSFAAQQFHQLQCWLSPSTVQDDLHARLAEYMTGSLEWVLECKEFKDWLDEPLYGSLRITGPPGSGKSTLAAFLVHHLSRTDTPVLYFFCNGNDNEKCWAVPVLRTLLAQLLRIDSTIGTPLAQHYVQSGRPLADSYYILLTAFEAVMAMRKEKQMYVIIDALDECRDRRLVPKLESLCVNAKAKLLVTHREGDDSRYDPPWSPMHAFQLRPEAASTYIRQYVSQSVHSIAAISNTDLETEVVKKVSDNANGLWLYARLMVDEIKRAPSKERLQKRLNSLPQGLRNLYTQILLSREEEMTEDMRHFAKYLYIWIDISDYMPYYLADTFDRLQADTLDLVYRFANGGYAVFDAARLTVEIGAPLIRITNDGSTYGLDFVHRSAYQYLTDSSQQPFTDLPQILRPQRLKHLYRGMTAVWYFTECSIFLSQLDRLRDPADIDAENLGSYFEMDYGLWDAFLPNLPVDLSAKELTEVETMCQRLIDFLHSGQVLKWFEAATIINYSRDFEQLAKNVLESLARTRRHSSVTAVQKMRRQYEVFFHHWAHAIGETTPWFLRLRTSISKPNQCDELSFKMMAICQKWSKKYENSLLSKVTVAEAEKFDKSFSKSEGQIMFCTRCFKSFGTRSEVRKHAHFCRGCSLFIRRRDIQNYEEMS